MASSQDNLYVTYVDVDRDLLKVWGQRNRIGATYIERQLLQLLPEFNKDVGPNPSEIQRGMFCFAKYTDDNYYRARVISRVQNDSVGVLFVDYGNRDIIKLSNIRIQRGKKGDVLVKMSEQAEEYYLARIAAPGIGWTKEIVSEIRRDICYDEFSYNVVAQAGDQKILEMRFHDEDFSEYLVKKQLASSLSLPVQRQKILSYCSLVSNDVKPEPTFREIPFSSPVPDHILRASLIPPNEGMIGPNNGKPKNVVNYPQGPSYIPPLQQKNSPIQQMNHNIPKKVYFSPVNHIRGPVPVNSSPSQPVWNPLLNNQFSPLNSSEENPNSFTYNNNIIKILAQQIKEFIAEDNAMNKTESKESEAEKIPHHYVNSVLEVGSSYNVIISHIDDGPWMFSIQLMSIENELQKLMDELSSTKLVPLKPPIILGCPCIAFSASFKNLCRGVVVSISHNGIKVYFVDFGNTEDLPASSIYELPPKFFKIRVLSQKFSLCGLQNVAYSEDIKKFFSEIVQDELLMLRVKSFGDDNLPTCELYIKNTNIKRILNEKIQELRNSEDEFPKVGDVEDVIVTWVVSPQKFFIQLQRRNSELKALKQELAEVEAKGQRLTYQQLSVGFKCVCRYDADGHWYRVVITSVDSENAITVFYVDYGNTETVNISHLRRIESGGLINQMSNQGIQCSLKGFENKPFDMGLAKKLEELALEKEFQMTVVSSEKELLCVRLIRNGVDISPLLVNSTLPIIDSFDSSTKNDVCSSVQANSFDKERVFESSDFKEKKNKSFRGEKTRGENKSNRPFGNFKSQPHSAPIHSKKRFEGKENLRDNKDKDSRWKFRNFTQEKENDWGNSKSGENWRSKPRDNSGDNKNRGFDRTRDIKRDNVGDRKKTDMHRGGREGRRFEGNVNRNSWRNGEESKRKFDRNGNMIYGSEKSSQLIKPIGKEEVAPPGSKFEDRVINIGSCENGIVTYYFSPDEFYVQLLSQEKEFTQMMKDIQKYYCDKYSIKNPLQTGDIVIAQFSLDKVLYRAEVIKPSPVTVRYVDYGNHEPIGLKSTWLVNKDFLKLPKQVVKCRLSNVRPVGPYWPPPGCEVDKFFSLSQYKCTFLSVEDDMYEISMVDVESGKDIASEIIAAGFGLPLESELDVRDIDFSLLPNQVLRLYVSHVESPSEFYVILNPIGLETIENEFYEDKKNLISLTEDLIKPETICLSTKDDISWYRGIVVKTDGNEILIRFIDRGDSAEVTPDKLMSLPDHLKVFQPQAIRCSLHEVPDIQNEQEFKQAVENKNHLISIITATDGSLSVVLYNEDGQKYDFQKSNDYPETIEPISHLPIITQKLPISISHFENPKEIYIQRLADQNELKSFSERISNFYSEENNALEKMGEEEIVEGMLVAAKSTVNDKWQRARLLYRSNEGLEVFYLDYGNKELLPFERVKKLDSSFFNLPAFSRKTTLDVDFEQEKIEEIKNIFIKFCNKNGVLGYFQKHDEDLIIEVVMDGSRITQSLQFLNLLSVNSPDKFSEILPVKNTETIIQQSISNSEDLESNGFKVLISHIDSPERFWVHKESAINDLHQLQDKLKQNSEILAVKENVNVSDIIAVQYSDGWYRGKVTNIDGTCSKVQFIDYGNTFDFDLTSTIMKELPNELLNVPAFAIPFALKGNWSENSATKFEEIILQNEDFINAVVLEETDPAVVDLFLNEQSITELLMEELCCDDDDDDVDVDDRSDLCIVYIANSNSPEDFSIHRKSCFDLYNKISERLSDVSGFDNVSSVEEGKLYIAEFSEDGCWYRARVNKKQEDKIEVSFIDYGNTSIVREIKCLPPDLMDVPKLAEHCCLVYGNNDTWSEAACEKFAELADGRELKMKVVAKKGMKSVIELFDGNSNVTKELEPLCEEDGRSEVYVTYASSPNDFYISYKNDENYKLISATLEEEKEKEELEEKTAGTLCQAPFEDGNWYRAEILQSLEEGFEVFFIDFGNVFVTTEVKKLPPEIQNIPSIALKCTLDLPETNIPESVKEEFISSAAGGSTVYRALIKVPGEVNVVSLKLNGRILEETLNLDVIPEEGSFGVNGHITDLANSETDDGKNSKNNSVSDCSNSSIKHLADGDSEINQTNKKE